jgi:hypothetical protein
MVVINRWTAHTVYTTASTRQSQQQAGQHGTCGASLPRAAAGSRARIAVRGGCLSGSPVGVRGRAFCLCRAAAPAGDPGRPRTPCAPTAAATAAAASMAARAHRRGWHARHNRICCGRSSSVIAERCASGCADVWRRTAPAGSPTVSNEQHPAARRCAEQRTAVLFPPPRIHAIDTMPCLHDIMTPWQQQRQRHALPHDDAWHG